MSNKKDYNNLDFSTASTGAGASSFKGAGDTGKLRLNSSFKATGDLKDEEELPGLAKASPKFEEVTPDQDQSDDERKRSIAENSTPVEPTKPKTENNLSPHGSRSQRPRGNRNGGTNAE